MINNFRFNLSYKGNMFTKIVKRESCRNSLINFINDIVFDSPLGVFQSLGKLFEQDFQLLVHCYKMVQLHFQYAFPEYIFLICINRHLILQFWIWFIKHMWTHSSTIINLLLYTLYAWLFDAWPRKIPSSTFASNMPSFSSLLTFKAKYL